MVKSDINYRIDFTKLESKVETMSDKLDDIGKLLKEIQCSLNVNHTDVALLSKDVDNIGVKCRELEVRVENTEKKTEENEKKINNLTIKVSTIVTIASIVVWFILNVASKFWN